jgi:tRNA pseudouridine38-40 synthase
MPQRLKLVVAYDGAAFAGWQSQSHRNTVQDNLERAFRKVTGKITRVHGAGRTDAGVHALAQCAHVDLADRRLSTARWAAALNALLPPTIRISRCQYVGQEFHARFSAKGKVYRYRIWSGPILPPLEFARAWHIPAKLDFDVIKAAAAQFVGTHDFVAFAANRGKSSRRGDTDSSRGEPETNTIRTIRRAVARRKGQCLTIEFDGNGFLYKMVRLMVGSMSRAALGKLAIDDIVAGLRSGRANGARFAAPAEGLFLVRVWY